MTIRTTDPDKGNVIDLFSRETTNALKQQRIIRVAPEYDGICMLYSNNHTRGNKLFTLKVLCWGLKANGDIVGLVPWLNKVYECETLNDPVHGQWEGYYDADRECIFSQPLTHKALELEQAVDYFEQPHQDEDEVIQEIPDTIGTHAMLNAEDKNSLILTEVISWRLLGDGSIEGMLIDEDGVTETPVLAGDPCLYPVTENPNFRFFFQHHIANQIKSEDPDALAAIAMLFDQHES
jgi:hypothetical protein